jgi:hypothetical protein
LNSSVRWTDDFHEMFPFHPGDLTSFLVLADLRHFLIFLLLRWHRNKPRASDAGTSSRLQNSVQILNRTRKDHIRRVPRNVCVQTIQRSAWGGSSNSGARSSGEPGVPSRIRMI